MTQEMLDIECGIGPQAAPFPYFGGKRRAAPEIWQRLGDPGGYTEPFAGSAAVLLGRPAFSGRRVETLNDADGWLVNTWRSIQLAPRDVARHAYGPVSEIDYHARLAWLQERRTPDLVSWLEGDPEAHDAKAAGWWLYVLACGIGDPFGPGPWRVVDGHLRKEGAGRGVNRKLPHTGDAGKGVNRGLPHTGDAGQGVNRELPHTGDAGYYEFEERLVAYIGTLSRRLERTRMTCGDWQRVVRSPLRARTGGDGAVAVFLDPPYATSGSLYAAADAGGALSAAARAWCAQAPEFAPAVGTARPPLRIALCGYDDEHDELLAHGWVVRQGKSGRGAGYSTRADNGRRERIWYSPNCLNLDAPTC